MKNYTEIVRNIVYRKVSDTIRTIIYGDIRTIVSDNVVNNVSNNVYWNVRDNVRNNVWDKRELFNYNSLQQYKDNL
jgi:hypothetical protein